MSNCWRVGLLVVVAIVMTACGSGSSGAGQSTGSTGPTITFLGQLLNGSADHAGLPGHVVATENGKVIATSKTDGQGNFSVSLQPNATYAIGGTTDSGATCVETEYDLSGVLSPLASIYREPPPFFFNVECGLK
jgi:hypothetical protein